MVVVVLVVVVVCGRVVVEVGPGVLMVVAGLDGVVGTTTTGSGVAAGVEVIVGTGEGVRVATVWGAAITGTAGVAGAPEEHEDTPRMRDPRSPGHTFTIALSRSWGRAQDQS